MLNHHLWHIITHSNEISKPSCVTSSRVLSFMFYCKITCRLYHSRINFYKNINYPCHCIQVQAGWAVRTSPFSMWKFTKPTTELIIEWAKRLVLTPTINYTISTKQNKKPLIWKTEQKKKKYIVKSFEQQKNKVSSAMWKANL